MVKAPEGSPLAYRNKGGYTRFIDQDGYPCQKPPWGELSAVRPRQVTSLGECPSELMTTWKHLV
jgi:hypothetical protein